MRNIILCDFYLEKESSRDSHVIRAASMRSVGALLSLTERVAVELHDMLERLAPHM